MKRLLILGGTGEAAALARAAGEQFTDGLEIVSSLAGRTNEPQPLPGKVRTGGFGGAEGLARWLHEAEIDMVVDATHPYATQISANARAACEASGIARLVLWRPPWTAQTGDNWIAAADEAVAARLLPGLGKRVFLALGSGQLRHFADVQGVWLMSRVAETPEPDTALPGFVVVGRGPFDADDELRLMEEQDIDLLVSRNSGGAATVGKITAARQRGIPVIMIDRPAPETGEQCSNLKEVLQWIARRL
ncbi:MAG: cobalt-precorrin-6A reductase, partial [Alphaproteobacteria bacterium]|nr:cobalt-precorrin-6A reductase [Alphaproteobacteria bacterium]